MADLPKNAILTIFNFPKNSKNPNGITNIGFRMVFGANQIQGERAARAGSSVYIFKNEVEGMGTS